MTVPVNHATVLMLIAVVLVSLVTTAQILLTASRIAAAMITRGTDEEGNAMAKQ